MKFLSKPTLAHDLRLPIEDMNLIHTGLLVVGYVLVGITVISAYICICFVVYYRNRSVLGKLVSPLKSGHYYSANKFLFKCAFHSHPF
jgi:hypothetical protein